jgi:hypothetical protein
LWTHLGFELKGVSAALDWKLREIRIAFYTFDFEGNHKLNVHKKRAAGGPLFSV